MKLSYFVISYCFKISNVPQCALCDALQMAQVD